MNPRVLFLSEQQKKEFLGGTKARNDIDVVLKREGYTPVICRPCRDFSSPKNVIDSTLSLHLNWHKCNKMLKANEILIIQYPFGLCKTNSKKMKKIKEKKNIKFIAIIHDLPSIQDETIGQGEEIELLKIFDIVICHNEKMKKALLDLGLESKKLVVLEIFDYLSDDEIKPRTSKNHGMTVAGNLTAVKANYIYKYIEKSKSGGTRLNLYGPNFELDNYEFYNGSLSPEELIRNIKGSYGLIWDGNSLDVCNGTFGEYQKINNPHRVSMNLAAKMPILIWKEAALRDFIIENGVGIEIDSLENIDTILDSVTDEDYEKMKANLEVISDKIKKGFYIDKAVKKAISKIKGV